MFHNSQQRLHNSSSTHADGMSHSNRSSVHVDSIISNIQQFHIGQGHNSESFIKLEVIDIADFKSRFRQHFLGGVLRSDWEVDWFDLSVGVVDYPG